MKKYFLLGSLLFASLAKAQLVNNGATIVVQSGGTIFCAGSFTNTSGTVTNDGKIEVQGNFVNGGTYNSTSNNDLLVLSGAGSATLNSGGATLHYLTIDKASNTDLVTLGGTVIVDKKLDFKTGAFSTDYLANPSFSVTAPALAIFAFGAGREIAGNVKRTGWFNGSPVSFNGENMLVTTAGGTTPTDLTVTMVPGGDPSQVEREVKRKFLFAATGGSGYVADVRFPYEVSELGTSNTEANLVPWRLVSSEWNARLTPVTRGATNGYAWVSTTGIDAASLTQEWKLADPRYTFNVTAYLRGPFSGSSMATALQSSGTLPLSQPYNIAPFNYTGAENVASIPNANVVDWILVELRKPVSGAPADALSSTIIGRKAGFLMSDGTIKDLDGSTSINFDITKQGSGNFITVRHRNHLGVMSNGLVSNQVGTFANNFSVLANSYKNPSATSDPVTPLPSSALYGLWSGDANRSGSVNGTDVTVIKSDIAAGNTGYRYTDVNLTNSINGTDVTLTKATISVGGGSSAPGRMSGKPVRTNLPDPVAD